MEQARAPRERSREGQQDRGDDILRASCSQLSFLSTGLGWDPYSGLTLLCAQERNRGTT